MSEPAIRMFSVALVQTTDSLATVAHSLAMHALRNNLHRLDVGTTTARSVPPRIQRAVGICA
ncbi:hypothetical protein CGZ80_18775 [Rhodopirellula sp. MGV]|nr:hypothetical protein CGZ80_18775 [Rhodopirellula sp. MGV]PNY35395.1 hypothetical protein C2E31_17940 [Rhodopirellula baltica]